jgi:hypothetical protein
VLTCLLAIKCVFLHTFSISAFVSHALSISLQQRATLREDPAPSISAYRSFDGVMLRRIAACGTLFP